MGKQEQILNRMMSVAVDDIVASKDNQRLIDKKAKSFLDLVESIKAGGIRVPVHVRPHPKRKGKYELRAGVRRWQAAIVLRLKTIPAIVHADMAELDALDLTYIENKFREQLTPLEEASEIANYIQRLGGRAKLIAEKLGKPEQWIRARVYVHKHLHPSWRAIFENLDKHPKFKNWTIAHLTRLARLPGHIQKELASDMSKSWQRPDTISVSALDQMIAGILKLLSKAKWNLDDQTLLPNAGACSQCTKRTGHQPMLWFASEEQVKSNDRCMDPHCWENKLMAWLKRQSKTLKEQHPKLCHVAREYPNDRSAEGLKKNFGQYLDPYDVEKSTRSTRGAVPALIIHGKGMGTMTYVKVKRAASSKPAKTGTPTPLKVRRQLLDAKRWAQVLVDLRERIGTTAVENIAYSDKVTGVMALAAFYGNRQVWDAKGETNAKTILKLIKDKKKGRTKALEYLWESLKPTLDNLVTYAGPITQTPKYLIEEAEWIAKLVRVDLKALFADVSKRKGFTVPKTWATLNADGTPKKIKSAKKKRPKGMIKVKK